MSTRVSERRLDQSATPCPLDLPRRSLGPRHTPEIVRIEDVDEDTAEALLALSAEWHNEINSETFRRELKRDMTQAEMA